MKKQEYVRPAIRLLDTHRETIKLLAGSGPAASDNPVPDVNSNASGAKGYGFGNVWDDSGTETETSD